MGGFCANIWPLERVIRMNEKPRPGDWDELIACYRALRKATAKNKPMKRKDRARISEHLRRLGWSEGAIGAATKPGPDLESSGGTAAKS
jgi:SOS response regulatory protein OraA/RecX